MSPRLDRTAGERRRRIRNHAPLVVAQEVAEPLARRARAQRMVEGEEQGLRSLEGRAARLAPELLAVAADLGWPVVAQDLHHGPTCAFLEGLLERAGQACLGIGAE